MADGDIKTVVLAGGFGTRLVEETTVTPKPMVEVGGKPMLWHILNIYASHGYSDFLIACGYKAEVIKEYFATFYIRNGDLQVDLGKGTVEMLNARSPDWRVACIDTGLSTMTGGRLLALRDHLADTTFMVTYGDGVADIDIGALVAFHRNHGRIATITAVQAPPRFGGLEILDNTVSRFSEKSASQAGWINGGFFVFEPSVLNYITGPETRLEAEPLSRLAEEHELMAFMHRGFWQPMDTLREKMELDRLWGQGNAPWKSW